MCNSMTARDVAHATTVEREAAAHVGVHNHKRVGLAAQHEIAEVIQAAGRTEVCVLLKVAVARIELGYMCVWCSEAVYRTGRPMARSAVRMKDANSVSGYPPVVRIYVSEKGTSCV